MIIVSKHNIIIVKLHRTSHRYIFTQDQCITADTLDCISGFIGVIEK